eukprot:TRINITY_DN60108_c0_g1_i1.p1 TRINITY_DN60108_c0_g1~~TRINITY_DN60108_c0_g1_i1.p1  ORF type:complete len:2441 (+),score=691.94 TRINITY_DN60108_c0_g1_i1:95-7324(+)
MPPPRQRPTAPRRGLRPGRRRRGVGVCCAALLIAPAAGQSCFWPNTTGLSYTFGSGTRVDNLGLAGLHGSVPTVCTDKQHGVKECTEQILTHVTHDTELRCDPTNTAERLPRIKTDPSVQKVTLQCSPDGTEFYTHPGCKPTYQTCAPYTQAELDHLNVKLPNNPVCQTAQSPCYNDSTVTSRYTVWSNTTQQSDPISCAMDQTYYSKVCYVECKQGYSCRDNGTGVCETVAASGGVATRVPESAIHTGMGLVCTCGPDCWNSKRKPKWTIGVPICVKETETQTDTLTLPSPTLSTTATVSQSGSATLPSATPMDPELVNEEETVITCDENYEDTEGRRFVTGIAVNCTLTARDMLGQPLPQNTLNVSAKLVRGADESGQLVLPPRVVPKNGAKFTIKLPVLATEGAYIVVARVYSVAWVGPEFLVTKSLSIELGPGSDVDMMCQRVSPSLPDPFGGGPYTLDAASEVADRLDAQLTAAQKKGPVDKQMVARLAAKAAAFNATDLRGWLYISDELHCIVTPTRTGCPACRLASSFDVALGSSPDDDGAGWEITPIGRYREIAEQPIRYNFTARSKLPRERLLNISIVIRSQIDRPQGYEPSFAHGKAATFAFTYGSPSTGQVLCGSNGRIQMRACERHSRTRCLVRLWDQDSRPVLPYIGPLPGALRPFGVAIQDLVSAPWTGCELAGVPRGFIAVSENRYVRERWGGDTPWLTEVTLFASAWGKGNLSVEYLHRSTITQGSSSGLRLEFLDKGVGRSDNTPNANITFAVGGIPSVRSLIDCAAPNPTSLVNGSLWLTPGSSTGAVCVLQPRDAYGHRIPAWPADFQATANQEQTVVFESPREEHSPALVDGSAITYNGTGGIGVFGASGDPAFAIAIPLAPPARWPQDRDTREVNVSARLSHNHSAGDTILRVKFGFLASSIADGMPVDSLAKVTVGYFPEPSIALTLNGAPAPADGSAVRVPRGVDLVIHAKVSGLGTNLPSFWREAPFVWAWSSTNGSATNTSNGTMNHGAGETLVLKEADWPALADANGSIEVNASMQWGPGPNETMTVTTARLLVSVNDFDAPGTVAAAPADLNLNIGGGRGFITVTCNDFSDSDVPLSYAVAEAPAPGAPPPPQHRFVSPSSGSPAVRVYPNATAGGLVAYICVVTDAHGAAAVSTNAVNVSVAPWQPPGGFQDDQTRQAQEAYALQVIEDFSSVQMRSVGEIAQAVGTVGALRHTSPVTLNRAVARLARRLREALGTIAAGRRLTGADVGMVTETALQLAKVGERTIAHAERSAAHAAVAAVLGALPLGAPVSPGDARTVGEAIDSISGTLSPWGEAAPQLRAASPLMTPEQGSQSAGHLLHAACVIGAGLSAPAPPGECRPAPGQRAGWPGLRNVRSCVLRVNRLAQHRFWVTGDVGMRIAELVADGVRAPWSDIVTVVGAHFTSSPFGFDATSKAVVGDVTSWCFIRDGKLLPVSSGSRVTLKAPVFPPSAGWHVRAAFPRAARYDYAKMRWATFPNCTLLTRPLEVSPDPDRYETLIPDTGWTPVNITAAWPNGTFSGVLGASGGGVALSGLTPGNVRETNQTSVDLECSGLGGAEVSAFAVISATASERCNTREIEGCVEVNSGTAESAAQCACTRCGHGYLTTPVDGTCRRAVFARCGEDVRVFRAEQCIGHSQFDELGGKCVCGDGTVCFGNPGVCTISRRCGEVAAELECLAAAALGGPPLAHHPGREQCACHSRKAGSEQWCDQSHYLHVCRPQVGCELGELPLNDSGLLAMDAQQRSWERGRELIYANYTYSQVDDPAACGFGSELDRTLGRCVCNSSFSCEVGHQTQIGRCVARGRCGEHPRHNQSDMCLARLMYNPTQLGVEYEGASLVRVVITETSAVPVTPVVQSSAQFAVDLVSMVFSWGGLNATELNATGVNTTRRSLRHRQGLRWNITNASSRAEKPPNGDPQTIAASIAIWARLPYDYLEPQLVRLVEELVRALDVALHPTDTPDGKKCVGNADGAILCKFETVQFTAYPQNHEVQGNCYCPNSEICVDHFCTCPVCKNGGVCNYNATKDPDNHNCTCPEGWEGADCSTREQEQYRFIHYRYPNANYSKFSSLTAAQQAAFNAQAASAFRQQTNSGGLQEGSRYKLLTAQPKQGSIVLSYTLQLFGSTFLTLNSSMGNTQAANALGNSFASLGLPIGNFQGGGVDTTLPSASNCSVIQGCLQPLLDCTCQTCAEGLMPNAEVGNTACVTSALCNLADCSNHGVPSGFQGLTPPTASPGAQGCSCVCAHDYSTSPGRLYPPFCDVDHCLAPSNWTKPECGQRRCAKRYDLHTIAGDQPGECLQGSSSDFGKAELALIIVCSVLAFLVVSLFVFYWVLRRLPWETHAQLIRKQQRQKLPSQEMPEQPGEQSPGTRSPWSGASSPPAV